MAEINTELRTYIDDVGAVLTDAYRELHAMHNYHYPDCGGGCPAHEILSRLAGLIIRTIELPERLGYSDTARSEDSSV